MTAQSAYRGRRVAWTLLCAAMLLAPFMAGPAHAAEAIKVELDRAMITRLPPHVSTVVIGNPLIADVTVQPNGLLVITGKSYGTTNMMALDRSGAVLSEQNIEVFGPRGDIVVVYRGVNRESYSCAPDCEPRITLGDSTAYFNLALGQEGTRSSRAQAAAPAQR
jgi:Flp pilus assembly secretin CpaC